MDWFSFGGTNFVISKFLTAAAGLFLSAGLVSATGHSAAGPNFTATCNAHGAKLIVEGKVTVYLGKSCDAHVVGQGDGRWFNLNQSFVVDAGNVYMNFGTRDVPCGLSYCSQ